jgi:succinyl-CoA synthetase beta subunit
VFEGDAFKNMVSFVSSLYKAYQMSDASLFEINPVLKSSDDKIIAVDSKVTLDDNALFRHKEYESMRDLNEENPVEVEARAEGLNYVDLDGNVGCMVNGAGLAMATMDLIKLAGGEPANFLDVGGTADVERVEKAFRLILRDDNVKAILVNIFGGIVRCDRVAEGIVSAYKNLKEIEDYRVELNIPKEKTYVMPAGDTRKTLIKMYPLVFEMVAKHGYNIQVETIVTAQHTLTFSSISSNISNASLNPTFCIVCYYMVSTCHIITVFSYPFKHKRIHFY